MYVYIYICTYSYSILFYFIIFYYSIGLRFTASEDGRLQCDEHGGLKVVKGRATEESLLRILCPFSRFVLLEDDIGDIFVLVSMADRPWPSDANFAGVALARSDAQWLAALRIDQRHQLYAVHASHQFLKGTTLAAELYLMLLRVLRGLFCDACQGVVACMASGVPREAEEALLWQEIAIALQESSSVDAAVLRLKLTLLLHQQGQASPEGWDPEADLRLWTRHGYDASAGHLLTLAEDAALLELCSGSLAGELRARRELQGRVLGLSAARGHCTHSPPKPGAYAEVLRMPCLAGEGPLRKGRALLDEVSLVQGFTFTEALLEMRQDEPPPGDLGPGQKNGAHAASFLLRHLPPQLPQDFLTLYELLTGVQKICLLPSDDIALAAELLAFVVPPAELERHPILATILRALHSDPATARDFPPFQGDLEDFSGMLNVSLVARMASLQLSPPSGESRLEPTMWRFRLSPDGRWQACDEPVERWQEGPGGDQEGSGGPLTNIRLHSLSATLRDLGDERAPSMIWDLDSGLRCFGETPGSAELLPELGDVCATLSKRMPGHPFVELPDLTTRPLMTVSVGAAVTSGKPLAPIDHRSPALDLLTQAGSPIERMVAGRKLLRRLQDDMERFAAEVEEPRLLLLKAQSVFEFLADTGQVDDLLREVRRLREAFGAMLSSDRERMHAAIRLTEELANRTEAGCPAGDRLARSFAQLGGAEVRSFADVLRLLLVQGGMETALTHVAPLVSARDAGDAAAACTLAMLLSSRTILIQRCTAQLARLQELLEQARADETHRGSKQPLSWLRKRLSKGLFGSSDAEQGALEKAQERACDVAEVAEQVARELLTEQQCFSGTSYDPRLLCFEFMSRIVLRGKQAALARSMLAAIQGGRPLVHQMLMGEGKTTVVTPLLVLLATTAEKACVVCCPAAILGFTCRVLRERMVGVLARPVLVFSFNRSTEVSDDLYLNLLHAQDARAALCCGPTALKSMMLRFLLTILDMDTTHSLGCEEKVVKEHRSRSIRESMADFMPWVRGQSAQEKRGERLKQLRYEVQVLSDSFRVFRSAVLVLDDIDLLMHPLRSELHWPLGESHRLDFTAKLGAQASLPASRAAAAVSFVDGSPIGARWQGAFHLLDGFFSCQLPPGPGVVAFDGSGQAAAILNRLQSSVKIGLQQKHLQASPHLALLSVEFYHEELLPILADWMLLWLRRRHPIAVPDAELLAYLCGTLYYIRFYYTLCYITFYDMACYYIISHYIIIVPYDIVYNIYTHIQYSML